mmetsp:Transcript_41972/g.97166  ORF Transcript_41972/g.97166 Transcript_41972/m.97166 type:complete len:220 (-) Transcript_41972:660-1319(-)
MVGLQHALRPFNKLQPGAGPATEVHGAHRCATHEEPLAHVLQFVRAAREGTRVDSLRVWHQRVFERTVARERPADVEAALPARHVHGGPAMLVCDVKVASPAVLHQVTHHGRVALLAGPEHRSPLRRVASGRARRRAVVEEPLDDLKVSVHACPRHAVPSRLVGDADILRRAVRVQELGDREVTVVAGHEHGSRARVVRDADVLRRALVEPLADVEVAL